jgi:tetratricopeptide (TPR) repeat protein
VGEYEKGEALLRSAVISAAKGKDDVLEAVAWGRLLWVVGELEQRFDAAAAIRDLGRTAIARARDPRAEADWLTAEGALLARTSRHAEAREAHERALSLREKALGPDHPDVAASLDAIGKLLLTKGDVAEAEAYLARALALRERALGPGHPDVVRDLGPRR